VLVAILALGVLAYLRVQTLSEIPPLTFPSTPLQTVPTIEPVLLPDPPPLGPEPFPASDPQ